MLTRLMKQRHKLLAMAVMLPLTIACSDNDPTSPEANAIAGRWQVTSYQVLGMEVIQEGLSIAVTFATAGTYTVDIHDETLGSCETANCRETGTYSATSTRITLDPESEETSTFSYSIEGNIMTLTGINDDVGVILRLQRL